MQRRNFSLSMAALAGGALTPALVQAQAAARWDLAAAYGPNNFHTQNLNAFARDVNAGTQGKLNITVHANASLFKAPEIKRAVQSGQAAAGEILLANFQNEWQVYGADGLPFLADSYDEAQKLYRAQKPVLSAKLAEQGMMLLYSVAWPPQGIFSRKAINTVADLRGTKWRAYSPATARLGELLQATPVTIQASDLAQAMATGVVDTFMTSGATGVDTKVFEHLKFYYDVQAWLPKNAVIVNKRSFDALDKPSQDAVLKAAADAEARGWRDSQRVTTESIATLRANGMTVAEPSAALKGELKKFGDTMLQDWLKVAGPEGKAIVDAFNR